MIKQATFGFLLLQLSLFAQEEPINTSVSYEFAFIKMIATLAILLALVFVSLWLLKRLSQGRLRQSNQNKAIKILERRSISPKTILYIVEYSGKHLLLAESQLEIRKIDESTALPH